MERLKAVAILRDGKIHEGGQQGHWQIRRRLNPDLENAGNTVYGDVDGFVTSTGRFVGRYEGREVAKQAGQVKADFARAELLSSDIEWDAKPPRAAASYKARKRPLFRV